MKLFNGHIKPITIITLTALCLFVSTPIFQIQPITESALIGVDIYATDQIYLNSMWHIIFASAFITILSMLTYMLHKEDVLERILILASGIFFGTYCSLIVYSTTLYYTTTVLTLLYQQLYTLAILFGFFGIATILFYGLTGIYFLKKIIQTCSPQSLFKKKQMKN